MQNAIGIGMASLLGSISTMFGYLCRDAFRRSMAYGRLRGDYCVAHRRHITL